MNYKRVRVRGKVGVRLGLCGVTMKSCDVIMEAALCDDAIEAAFDSPASAN